jgi:ketosteroid isomerase-like protein
VEDLIRRLRSAYAALSRDGDFSAILDEFDPDVELRQSGESPEGLIVHRGYEGLAKWREDMSSAWDEVNYSPLELDQADNLVLVVVQRSVKGRTTKLRLEQTVAHIFTLGDNGKVVRIDAFLDPDKARNAFRRRTG